MKTYMQKTAEVERAWHLRDASGQVLGRFATEIAELLIGKHKATYTPHIDGGDYVVVTNAAKVVLTRNKAAKKTYVTVTQKPGGIKEIPFSEMIEKYPERVIQKAVKNMLPKNKLRSGRMTRLKVYAGDEHPHASQFTSTKESKE